jgi:proline racemase
MAKLTRFVSTIDSHTAGECTRLVMSGLPPIPGQTAAQKLAYAEEHLPWVPGFLLLEPRGHKDMFGAVLVPPCSPDADVGVLFMDNQVYEPMCGHAVIGTVTTLLETGMFELSEPETLVTLDTLLGWSTPPRGSRTGA